MPAPMKANALIVRYGEISLKGRNRSFFEKRLCDDIRSFLKDRGIAYSSVVRIRGRIYVRGIEKTPPLEEVMGIFSYSPALEVPRDMAAMEEAVLGFTSEVRAAGTFRISCQRVDKTFPVISTEVERILGERVRVESGASVNLGNPAFDLQVEIGNNAAFVFSHKIRGFGGMPYGSAGKLVSLISTGIDSPVATFLMMKRGVEPVLLHFAMGPEERAKMERIRGRLERYAAGRRIQMEELDHESLFDGQFSRLRSNSRMGPYVCVICKYLMHRNAGAFARRVGALGVITGDSLAQVASQTLSNMAAYRLQSELPVYTPLIGMDKLEIIDLAKRIGTYDLSIAKAPGCSPPAHPRTSVDLKQFQRVLEESGLFSDSPDSLPK